MARAFYKFVYENDDMEYGAGTTQSLKPHPSPHSANLEKGKSYKIQKVSQSQSDSDDIEETDPERAIDELEPGVVFILIHSNKCHHCKIFKPHFEKIAKDFASKAKFRTVLNEVLQHSKNRPQIKGYPTVVAYKNGKHAGELVGNQGYAALHEFVVSLSN